jgi:hypothetical protein
MNQHPNEPANETYSDHDSRDAEFSNVKLHRRLGIDNLVWRRSLRHNNIPRRPACAGGYLSFEILFAQLAQRLTS